MKGPAPLHVLEQVVIRDLNPKSISTQELYGYVNLSTREWKDGLLSCTMRELANVPDDNPKSAEGEAGGVGVGAAAARPLCGLGHLPWGKASSHWCQELSQVPLRLVGARQLPSTSSRPASQVDYP